MARYIWAAVLIGLLLLVAPSPVLAQSRESNPLVFFEPGTGTLNDDTTTQSWSFDGHANEVISLVASAKSGDLDPMIALIGPNGESIEENDDLDSLVTDAGLEGFTLPEDGQYVVEVSRYGETSGDYELSLTPGFARVVRRDSFTGEESPWLSASTADSVSLAQERLQVKVLPSGTVLPVIPDDAELLKDVYFQTSAKLYGQTSYAEVGMIFREQGSPTIVQAYEFKVNTEGKWTVLLQNMNGQFALQTWTANDALKDSTEWTLAVLARENNLSFYANGVLLGTLTDDQLNIPGRMGLLVGTRAGQADPATVNFDDVVVTARLGSTYHGLPLALTTWDSADPGRIKDELFASGQINPASARDLYVPDTLLSSNDQETQFHLIGTEQAVYSDFLFGATVNIATKGQSVACGVIYRWQDDGNLDLAYIDTAGGFGLVQARNGDLTTNVYDLNSQAVLVGSPNRLLIVARGNRVALYVNGALATEETVQPGSGRVGAALLNYEDVATDCYWGDLWVWPLNGD